MNRRHFLISAAGAGYATGAPLIQTGRAQNNQAERATDIVVGSAYKPQNLMNPPVARTDNSIALLWDKPALRDGITQYNVYANGQLVGTADRTTFNVTKLAANTSYSFTVRSVLKDGKLSEESNTAVISTHANGPVFDITKYGAVGDGQTLNTQAIQQAIDACTPGSTLYFPKGVFLSGALWLKSDMVVHVSEGATLLGSPKADDYPLIM